MPKYLTSEKAELEGARRVAGLAYRSYLGFAEMR